MSDGELRNEIIRLLDGVDLKAELEKFFLRQLGLWEDPDMERVKGKYIGEVMVEEGTIVQSLDVWQNPVTGKIFAVDTMDMPAARGYMVDPYDPHYAVEMADTFSGLPK